MKGTHQVKLSGDFVQLTKNVRTGDNEFENMDILDIGKNIVLCIPTCNNPSISKHITGLVSKVPP